jgi:hypothetical protein
LINPWERVRILRAGLVETSEVHAETPTAISFGHNLIRITPMILDFCPDLSQRVYPNRNLPITQ